MMSSHYFRGTATWKTGLVTAILPVRCITSEYTPPTGKTDFSNWGPPDSRPCRREFESLRERTGSWHTLCTVTLSSVDRRVVFGVVQGSARGGTECCSGCLLWWTIVKEWITRIVQIENSMISIAIQYDHWSWLENHTALYVAFWIIFSAFEMIVLFFLWIQNTDEQILIE